MASGTKTKSQGLEWINLLLYDRDRSEALLEVLVCRDDIRHLSVVICLICGHIEVACTCEVEQDRLCFARLLALESLVDSSADSV